jgi:hypothetical protein
MCHRTRRDVQHEPRKPLLSIFAKEISAVGVMIGFSVAGYWCEVLLEIPSGFISARYGYYMPMWGLSDTAGTFWVPTYATPTNSSSRALQESRGTHSSPSP